MTRQLHLNLFVQARGHHEAAWKHPDSSPASLTDVNYYVDIAQRAEKALFDSIFFADSLMLTSDAPRSGRIWLDPITLLAAIAVKTERIGMIATGSSTYSQAYNLARQYSTIDHISKGRVGWNIVTTWMEQATRNFTDADQNRLSDRYIMAEEFVQIVKDLWDSWADDAVVDDRDGGVFVNSDRIRPIDFKGKYYSVAGPLNLPRCPQGRPVLVQAGSSDAGRDFASRHAEAVFTAHLEKETAQKFYSDIKKRAVAAGRAADQILVLPGLNPMIASTETEAKRKEEELNESTDPEVGRQILSTRFDGHDFSHLPLDRPLTPDDFPQPSGVETMRSRAELIVNFVRNESPTLSQLLARFASARGHFTFAGTPEQVANLIEDWFRDSAADGFNVMPPVFPTMLDVFAEEVIPILQRRDLFRTEYKGWTLREHYGLDRPAGRFW